MIDNLDYPVLTAFFDLLEQALCIIPGNRYAGNGGDVASFRASRIFVSRVSRCRGIARVDREELYGAALHGVEVTCGALRISGIQDW